MRKRGFTIIELLVTIIIIGILLAAAGISYNKARKNGRDSKRIGDVLLIAQAIDSSASLARGRYPQNVVGGNNQSTMCASELYNAANPNNIDLSLFSTHAIPIDPLPYNMPAKTIGCLSYQDGYVYRSVYPLGSNPLATQKGYTYLLEVGLEGQKPNDETTFFDGTEIGQAAVTTPRYQYFYLGKYCGTHC